MSSELLPDRSVSAMSWCWCTNRQLRLFVPGSFSNAFLRSQHRAAASTTRRYGWSRKWFCPSAQRPLPKLGVAPCIWCRPEQCRWVHKLSSWHNYCSRTQAIWHTSRLVLYYIKNQQDATLAVLFISHCKITLHVSDAFCVHHQEY